MDVGAAVRRIRLSKGLTQAQVAEGLFDRSYLSQIEHGKVRPSLETLRLLAQRLDVPLESLVPFLEYETSYQEALALLEKGRQTRNVAKLRVAWRKFFGLRLADQMLEGVLAWSECSPYTPELLDALSTTLLCAAAESAPSHLYWEASIRLGHGFFNLRQWDRAAWVYRDIIDRNPPSEVLLRAWLNLGSTLLEMRNFQDAVDAFETALGMAERHNDVLGKAKCLHGLGVCYRSLGLLPEAIKATQAAKDIYELRDVERYFMCVHNLAVLWLDTGDFACAAQCLETAKKHFSVRQNTMALVSVYEEYARLHFLSNDYDEALHHVDMACRLLNGQDMLKAGRLFLWKVILFDKLHEPRLVKEWLTAALAILGDQLWNALEGLMPPSQFSPSELRSRIEELSRGEP